jgi:hypothetical protein
LSSPGREKRSKIKTIKQLLLLSLASLTDAAIMLKLAWAGNSRQPD